MNEQEMIIDSESKLKKNIVRLLLLTVCASVIYGLPYMRWLFYEPFIEQYQLTNEQLGLLGSAYGFFGLISYLLGGVLADKFSAKKLVCFSLLATGAGGIVHYFTASYAVLLSIYAIWGLTSLLTFWPALIKAVRLTGGSKEQSRVFGIFEGGRGLVYTVNDSTAVAVFGVAVTGFAMADTMGFKFGILYYSAVTIIMGVLCIFILKETEVEKVDKTKFEWGNVKEALKLPAIWMIAFILCCTYAMNISYSYFNPYSINVFGASTVQAAMLVALAQYVRPFSAPGAGFLADRIGRPNIMRLGFSIMAVGTAISIVLPSSTDIILLYVLCAVIYVGMYMNYGVVFSLMDEGGIPLKVSGTAIGIVCTIGYLPEVICPFLAGRLIDTYDEGLGFKFYFSGIIVMMIIGIVLIQIWKRKRASGTSVEPDATSVSEG